MIGSLLAIAAVVVLLAECARLAARCRALEAERQRWIDRAHAAGLESLIRKIERGD